jgi:four helix bundle protein
LLDIDIEKFILLRKSHELALSVYKTTQSFPKEEVYSLTSQIRRSAVSIPSNILEGKARKSKNEYERFLLISRGSLEELSYQMLLSRDLSYINSMQYDEFLKLSIEVGKLLNGVINSLKNKTN